MKTLIISLLLAGVCYTSSYSQVVYPITIEKKGFSKVYYQNNVKINRNYELNSILKSTPASAEMINSSLKNMIIGSGFLLVSIIPWGASLFVMEDDPETAFILSGVALGISLSSLPFMIRSSRQRRQAIDLYNGNISDFTDYRRINIQIGVGLEGACMRVTF